mmetsp:Transcript_31349/g.48068  ORF Transcript_31349/g.48068 Transcript_31349/m.48068 type:complete len:81 (+) Transcript_31349:1326-1568(+)
MRHKLQKPRIHPKAKAEKIVVHNLPVPQPSSSTTKMDVHFLQFTKYCPMTLLIHILSAVPGQYVFITSRKQKTTWYQVCL